MCVLQVWWLLACTAAVGCLPDGRVKQRVNSTLSLMCFNFLSRCISAVVTYHSPELRPRSGICVANHTSPIDVLVLMCDSRYSLVSRGPCFLHLLSPLLSSASLSLSLSLSHDCLCYM